jgi:phosphoglucosamine mutase
VLFADFPAGDGLVAGLRALGSLGGASLADTMQRFRPLPRRLGKLRVGARPPLDEVEALSEVTAEASGPLGEGGRVFLRYSGTEPVLRILVEGATPEVVDRWYDRVEAVARGALA